MTNQPVKRSTRRPAASHEIELKFTLPADRLRALAQAGLAWPGASAPTIKPLITRYYDTPTALFWRHGLACRVRCKGDQWLQHLKWRGVAAGTSAIPALTGGSVRTEWEWQLTDDQPDTLLLEQALDGALRLPKNWRRKLVPLFETDLHRTVQTVTTADGSVIEIAYDLGVVRAGAAERVLAEVELELEAGAPLSLYAVADSLVRQSGARLAGGSKAEQGYRLALNKPPKAQKAAAGLLQADDTGWRALQVQAGHSLQALLANQTVVLADSGPEGVHQMRVALRRLDAVMRPLQAGLTSEAAKILLAELRILRQALGQLRNWDVFLTETLVNLPEPDSRTLLRPAAQIIRDDAQQAVVRVFNEPRYADLLLKLAQLADGAAPFDRWSRAVEESLNRPFRSLATRWLIETMTLMQRQGRKLATLPPAKQHRFRLKMKKARYVADILVGSDDTRKLRKTTRQMASLQDALGDQNDAFTALELLEALARHPCMSHDTDAVVAIMRQQNALHAICHKPMPEITADWDRIVESFDAWIMARRG